MFYLIFFEKACYKKSQLERSKIKKNIQKFINICSHVPFQLDEFEKKTLRFPINLELFEKLELSQVANRPFYASLFFVLDKAMFLEKKMWEIQVIDKDNNSHLFSIHCYRSWIRNKKEIFVWKISYLYFDIHVYFDDFNPEISKFESYDDTLFSHKYKKMNVVIKSSILKVEGLDCFKNYYKLISSIYKEVDEPNLSESTDEMFKYSEFIY